MKRIEALFRKYSYLWVIPAYAVFYLTWFIYLENRSTPSYHIIHTVFDDYIPFNEIFIIPYYLWFLFVPFAVFLTIMADRQEFNRCFTFLSIGMTVFLIISAVYPNGALLRPSVFPRDNIFTSMVMGLYATDTATNLFPSIHVYNSLGAMFAILCCEKYKNNHLLRAASVIMCVLIILSTVFLKQHSVFDVVTGLIMGLIMYILVYELNFSIFPENGGIRRIFSRRSLS